MSIQVRVRANGLAGALMRAFQPSEPLTAVFQWLQTELRLPAGSLIMHAVPTPVRIDLASHPGSTALGTVFPPGEVANCMFEAHTGNSDAASGGESMMLAPEDELWMDTFGLPPPPPTHRLVSLSIVVPERHLVLTQSFPSAATPASVLRWVRLATGLHNAQSLFVRDTGRTLDPTEKLATLLPSATLVLRPTLTLRPSPTSSSSRPMARSIRLQVRGYLPNGQAAARPISPLEPLISVYLWLSSLGRSYGGGTLVRTHPRRPLPGPTADDAGTPLLALGVRDSETLVWEPKVVQAPVGALQQAERDRVSLENERRVRRKEMAETERAKREREVNLERARIQIMEDHRERATKRQRAAGRVTLDVSPGASSTGSPDMARRLMIGAGGDQPDPSTSDSEAMQLPAHLRTLANVHVTGTQITFHGLAWLTRGTVATQRRSGSTMFPQRDPGEAVHAFATDATVAQVFAWVRDQTKGLLVQELTEMWVGGPPGTSGAVLVHGHRDAHRTLAELGMVPVATVWMASADPTRMVE
ncbi:hypothetical protein BC828DRAFT_192084 [Blastocladiella britannica]|nr:hypothetical protein BC828DRAFT_192084 [Blastocladiella britannica]